MAKILIADDSQFMRKVLNDILTKNGYTELVEAENGVQAIEKFASEKPDLMLMDIIMPEKDGIEVLKEIVPNGANVLVVSAVGQEDMIKQATDAGAKGYIVKPFEEEQVMEEVKKLIG
jgi:two-component system, chemotaxis family, chemotaxis protein CheY